MGTKVRKNDNNINFNNHCIDSARFLIDSSVFDNVNIPENFSLVCSETSEVIHEFKKKSLPISYNNTVIYLGSFKRYLKDKVIDKVQILVSSKIAGENYFYGIQKHDIRLVLEHLRQLSYIEYKDVDKVIKELYCVDMDVKRDISIDEGKREELKEFNKDLKKRFNGDSGDIHFYDSKQSGFGIQAYTRQQNTRSKMFLKFYDKSKELHTKSRDFYNTLPASIQVTIDKNFIYRFEFTLKDKKFFDKFGISNKFLDVLDVSEEKWKVIGREYMDSNFNPVIRKPRNKSVMTSKDRILAMKYIKLKEFGMTDNQLRVLYLESGDEKKRNIGRQVELFERIYHWVNEEYNEDLQKRVKLSDDWVSILGF